MSESFLNDRITLHPGDCPDVLAMLPENSIDSCVTDPPYHLVSIVKRFGNEQSLMSAQTMGNSANTPFKRTAKGFMGKVWDGGNIAQSVELWSQVYRVLKPGAHLLAFGGTRTYHRMACAIEDAGFEIRDQIQWLYGSGFPKSHDVSKGIDRAAGAERETIGRGASGKTSLMGGLAGTEGEYDHDITIPATDAARQWQGWGTALKPAYEPIVLARKPLSEKTVAANVLKWGTGAINVDGTRIPAGTEHMRGAVRGTANGALADIRGQKDFVATDSPLGRWPANVIHDGSDEVVGAFPESSPSKSADRGTMGKSPFSEIDGSGRNEGSNGIHGHDDNGGSAARFFYSGKADKDDRLGSSHPTIKPVDLMQYLVRLVTPKNGTVLDCFAGTGTTGEAAWREGMKAVLIEREVEYQADIRRRMALCLAGSDERRRESIKARLKDKPLDHGPLFGAIA